MRRWGLGLAVGGALSAGWLLRHRRDRAHPSPIGPGYANPLFRDAEPHAVTIVGFALAGFFALVAVVMALLDANAEPSIARPIWETAAPGDHFGGVAAWD